MSKHNTAETPTIATNNEFFDAESSDDNCCASRSNFEIQITKIRRDGEVSEEEYCCAKCGRPVQELARVINKENEDVKSNETKLITNSEPLENPKLVLNGSQEIVSETEAEATVSSAADSLSKTTALSCSADSALLQDPIWRGHKKHIFILSEAGKPIYSLNGSEDKLAILFGIIQALVSFVENTQDVITSIHAKGIQFVFMTKSHLILVAASRTNMSVTQLQMQLNDVHNQILSTLTFAQLTKIFQQRKNFDLRRLLEGSERLINNLLLNDSSNKKVTNNVFAFLTNSIRCLPLQTSMRNSIANAIRDNCGKIKNLVFAILIAKNRLVSLMRMKKYSIHPSDLRLIFNLIDSTESFKASENWTPICLPKFDLNGYLHAHVSYLEDTCPACLLLLTVDRDDFFTLSNAKKAITEKLKKSQCLEAINEAVLHLTNPKYQLNSHNIGIPELRHFLYKPKSTAQVLCSELVPPYTSLQEFERLEAIYCDLLERVHHTARPLKLIFEAKSSEVTLAWSTATYELFAVFEPLTKKSTVIKNVDKLIKWVDKEYDTYFIRTHPTF